MAASPHPATVAKWRDRLRRFSRSKLSVARFCVGEHVSPAAFYAWRKRLAAPQQNDAESTPAFQTVIVTSSATPRSLSIELASGARIEVPADNLELVRLVVAELAQVDSKQGVAAC